MTAKIPSTPWFLRLHRWVAHVETLALACTAAAGATAVFGSLMKGVATGLVAGVPTLVAAGCWVGLVRLNPRFGEEQGPRARWMAALPLAALNGAAGAGLFCSLYGGFGHGPSTFVGGAIFGATVGIVFWGPALLATLLVLGGPLRFAQRKASQGLSGEDLGGKALGGTAAAASVLALVWQLVAQESSYRIARSEAHAIGSWLRPLGQGLGYGMALLGVVGGAIVLAFSVAKSAKRKAFVTRVEHGIEQGFRVDPTQRGKVLVKLRAPREPFRTTNLPEEVFPL
jgi:hypothetical protein